MSAKLSDRQVELLRRLRDARAVIETFAPGPSHYGLARRGLVRRQYVGMRAWRLQITPAGLRALLTIEGYDQLKHDPRDRFVRVGGFHGAWDDPRFVTFMPHDANEKLDGKADPLPPYAVRIDAQRGGQRRA